MFKETEQTAKKVEGTQIFGLDNKLLCHGVLFLVLPHREVIERQEVIVEFHAVIDILIACRGGDCHAVEITLNYKTVGDVKSLIRTLIIVGYRGYLICHGIVMTISPTALAHIAGRKGVVDAPVLCRQPLQAQTQCGIVATVAVGAKLIVPEVAVAVIIHHTYRPTEGVTRLGIVRCLETNTVCRSILQSQTLSLEIERRHSVEIYCTTRGVAPKEQPLCSTHNLHTVNVKQLKIVTILVHYRHAVDVHAHHRLVHARAETTHIHRRCHARTIVGLIEIGSKGREFLDRCYVTVLQFHTSQRGRRILARIVIGNLHR